MIQFQQLTEDVSGLLPCPFCGSAAVLELYVVRTGQRLGRLARLAEDSVRVKCTSCFAQTDPLFGGDSARGEAIHMWNSRPMNGGPN